MFNGRFQMTKTNDVCKIVFLFAFNKLCLFYIKGICLVDQKELKVFVEISFHLLDKGNLPKMSISCNSEHRTS